MIQRVLVLVCLVVFALTSISQAFALGERSLKAGMRGDDVIALQSLLASKGYDVGEVDGVYGGQTTNAVMRFQLLNDMNPDGIAGPETFTALRNAPVQGAAPSRSLRTMTVVATAYSSQDPGVGHYTARGHWLTRGIVAVDPSVIPLGTRVYVEGYGYAVADDTGGAIHGNRIDVAFDTHYDAVQFGVQTVQIYIVD